MIVSQALKRREKRTPGYVKNIPDIGGIIAADGGFCKGDD
jgi:hypothetical protein